MSRQSITLTEPNNNWLQAKVESMEYASKSEIVNDLIRQARNQHHLIGFIKNKIEEAEESGFTTDSKEDILKAAKSTQNG